MTVEGIRAPATPWGLRWLVMCVPSSGRDGSSSTMAPSSRRWPCPADRGVGHGQMSLSVGASRYRQCVRCRARVMITGVGRAAAREEDQRV